MKQSSSTHLGGIPIDTKTLAGQWTTFSHMANHYRKLLNVKPRVDTGLAPTGSFHHHTMQSSKSVNKMGCVPSKWRNSTNSNSRNNNNSNLTYTPHESMRLLYGSHPDHLNTCSGIKVKECKSPLKGKSKKQQPVQQHYPPHHHQQEYQVVFGPSSIRSSTDAFLSDESESLMSNDKPPSEVAPIGVTEKIRRFLNHIHQLDLKTTSTNVKPKRVTTAPLTTCPLKTERAVKVPSGKGRSTPTSGGTVNLATNSTIDFRLSRHSKCFLPCEPKSPSKKSTAIITSPVPTKSKKIFEKSGGSRKASSKVVGEARSNSYAHHFHSPRMSRKLFHEEDHHHLMLPEKEMCNSNKKPGKSRKRAGSMASIGTICGSDELTAEDFPITIKDICATIERGILPDDDLIIRMNDNHRKSKKAEEHTNSRKPVGKTSRHSSGIRISSSMTSLVPSSSKSNTNGGAQATSNNNKDSSRDSAYGFSSGESRITTRESTPEKKCREFVSNAKSHIDLQDKPCKDVHEREDFHNSMSTNKPSFGNLSNKHHRSSKDHNSKSHSHSKKDCPIGKKTRSSYDLKKQQSSERYITFLAEVTQDIVSKGIYTNKGLKNLFKSHMDQNKELNHDKLSDMMERLRMDLGIPKDDALDKIEFGYGSINNTANNTFFYAPREDKVPNNSVTSKMDTTNNVDTSFPSTSTSPPTIIPNGPILPATTNTTSTTGFFSSGPNTSSNQSTTDEGGDVMSGPSSEHDDDNDKRHENGRDDDDDELNFSEEEVTQALKLAGLDDGATEEVMEILNI